MVEWSVFQLLCSEQYTGSRGIVMTVNEFRNQCEEYLTSKGCKIIKFDQYLAVSADLHYVCEFKYKDTYYRLNLNSWYNIWNIYKHESYPEEMKRCYTLLQGKLVYSSTYKNIAESLDKFFKEDK